MSRLNDLPTSKKKFSAALAILAALALTAPLLFRTGGRLAVLLGVALLAAVIVLVIRAVFRRPPSDLIERSFETSTLAFPPEVRLGRRDLRRR